MFSREYASEDRAGLESDIKYTWTRKTLEHSVLVATCPKINNDGKVVGQFAAYKEAYDLRCDPDTFASNNNWIKDLQYEIVDQITNPIFGHFDLETYISIHNTSIRTRA
jgi:hypothetical protein